MNEALVTLEGWYALHDFRTINWTSWQYVSTEERGEAIVELLAFLEQWSGMEANNQGSTSVYSIVGQKADIVFVHLRDSLEQLNELETAFNKTKFAQHLLPSYSYVSVVELSNYMNKPGVNPMENPDIVARLKPIMPKKQHICFYPMNKRREGSDNWYMLSMDERRTLMHSHGLIGRSYAGRVKQIITGSIGFDDWEWGVTLFADDPLVFKKLIYEMRFDEVSARYADFGEFYIGNILDSLKLQTMLHI